MNNKENKVRVAIYARSANGGDISINEQIYQLSEYIKSIPNSIEVAHYADVCASGLTIKNRNDFQKMMVDAEKGLFDMIVTQDVSHFTRNALDTIHYVNELKQFGVAVHFVGNYIRTDDYDGEFRLTLLAGFCQDEKRKHSERVRRGQKAARDNGVAFGNGNVLGYDRVDGKFIINLEQAETVRMIFDLYLNGNSIRNICAKLEEQGKLTSTGKPIWKTSTVARTLKNPLYCGKIYYPKSQKCVTGTHEPIISEETFEKAKRKLQERKMNYDTR